MDPVTGFYRDGCCSTGPEDLREPHDLRVVHRGVPEHQRSIGNEPVDAQAGVPLPGLVPGDRWCVTAVNWALAYNDGVAARWCLRPPTGPC